jgi:pimeloyl-ACP methyl ester carboxylesterase
MPVQGRGVTTELSIPTLTTHVILVPGYWLGAWAWDAVVPALCDAGLVPHAVTLPGLESVGADRSMVTLDAHVAAVRGLVDTLDGDVVLVGHSGGGVVVQMVTDQRPDRIRRVVYVDAGPVLDGVALSPGSPAADLPLPSWTDLEAAGSSLAGLDDTALARFRELAVPQPCGVATAPVRVSDPRRFAVPTTVICTSIPSEVLQELIATGQMPAELPFYTDVEYVDLPTGHWPMLSRPADLGVAIADAATR